MNIQSIKIKPGTVIECHNALELYWLLESIEEQLPHLKWQSRHKPTEWFPRQPVGGIDFMRHYGQEDLCMVCWNDGDNDYGDWVIASNDLVRQEKIPETNPIC